MPETNDQILVERAQKDPKAFAALYDRYVGRIYAYAYRQTNNEALAKDVTSATFEKALRHIRRYQWQGASFCAWLYRIARNEIIQHQRRRRFLAPLLGQRPPDNGHVSADRMPEAAVQRSERRQELQVALSRLSAQDREIVTLRFFEELSSAEVAEILGCSTDNVYVRLHRALQRLRQQLDLLAVIGEAESHEG
ncbi:MAG TPA: sigma-70 family RNA polymerase sigma factor [Anaerolineae bacterium]